MLPCDEAVGLAGGLQAFRHQPRMLDVDIQVSFAVEQEDRGGDLIGEAGGSRWALDQLEGLKSPSTLSPTVSSAAPTDVRIDINDWPAIESAPTPLPLTIAA